MGKVIRIILRDVLGYVYKLIEGHLSGLSILVTYLLRNCHRVLAFPLHYSKERQNFICASGIVGILNGIELG